jgi:hypothetical protein
MRRTEGRSSRQCVVMVTLGKCGSKFAHKEEHTTLWRHTAGAHLDDLDEREEDRESGWYENFERLHKTRQTARGLERSLPLYALEGQRPMHAPKFGSNAITKGPPPTFLSHAHHAHTSEHVDRICAFSRITAIDFRRKRRANRSDVVQTSYPVSVEPKSTALRQIFVENSHFPRAHATPTPKVIECLIVGASCMAERCEVRW